MRMCGLLQVLGHACRQELTGKITTLEQDEAILNAAGDQISWRLWNALQLRTGHKNLLHKCTAQADAAIVFLEIQQNAVSTGPGQPQTPDNPALQLHSEL